MTYRHSNPARLAALFAVLALAGACTKGKEPAAAAGPVESVAKVNGQPIPQSEFDLYVSRLSRQAGRELPAEQRSELLDQFIAMKLAAEEAEKNGLSKDPNVADQLELARMNVLLEAGVQKHLEANPVQDSELKPEYDAQVAAMPREYHARHILVDDKAVADQITQELKNGADFGKLAKQKSKDSTAREGGDLGWFTLDSMVKPFSDAVASLQPGQLTEQPVQSQFGWHVIKLDETRGTPAPPFEEVKDQVKMFVQRKKVQTYFDELRKNAKIEKVEKTEKNENIEKNENVEKKEAAGG